MRKLQLEELNRDSLSEYHNKEKPKVIVVLDNIRSGNNVGSIFRTCDAFAFEKIILCGYTPQPPHKEINKTAIGAHLSVPWQHFDEISSAIAQLKSEGYRIYGIEQTSESVLLQDAHFSREDSIALVFGNEVNGLTDDILPHLDEAIEIDQYGTKHSLNVAVCAGMVLWEVNKAVRELL
ncbi:MAG: RNA methyltransferase [Bacteroidia bacterium]|nr:RNA methyltransferase [Bacteroidia bacterium]